MYVFIYSQDATNKNSELAKHMVKHTFKASTVYPPFNPPDNRATCKGIPLMHYAVVQSLIIKMKYHGSRDPFCYKPIRVLQKSCSKDLFIIFCKACILTT